LLSELGALELQAGFGLQLDLIKAWWDIWTPERALSTERAGGRNPQREDVSDILHTNTVPFHD